MAAAMARGWVGAVDRMLFTDAGSGRAAELAAEVDGEALDSNAELAAAADLVVLAVKPAAFEGVAAELSGAKAVVSLLAATSLKRVEEAFPESEVARVMPNVAVELRRGVLCLSGRASPELRALLELLGLVAELPDDRFDIATAVVGCSPAYLTVAIEAISDSGAMAGIDGALARELMVETVAGTAELLRERLPSEVREAVAPPGGVTEAGLEELELKGARLAYKSAILASLERMRE